MSINLLVLDASQRSALAVTRSLGKLSNVNVYTADHQTAALAGQSKYSKKYFQSPNAEKSPQSYLAWLEQLTQETHFELVLPVTEITSQLLLIHQAEFPQIKLPFATYETVMKLADKGALIELAAKLTIPHPNSTRYNNAHDLKIDHIRFPVVLKPCLSKIYAGTEWIATSVNVLHSKDDLTKALETNGYLWNYPFMLQEFIPGYGAGIFCLYDHGKPITFFAHNRLREKPPQGGISVLSESVPLDAKMLNYATQLLNAVSWHGVAMVEFRQSPDGTPYLMEVNTRFWGSLQLSIDSGIDFPKLLYMAERNLFPEAVTEYVLGQRLRWLLGDVDSLYLYLRSNYRLGEKLLRICQFLTPRLRKCRHEINRLEDFAPAIYEAKLYIKQVLRRA